jgi:hypothetical protein
VILLAHYRSKGIDFWIVIDTFVSDNERKDKPMEKKQPRPERISFQSAGALSPQAKRRLEEARREAAKEAEA